MLRLVSLHSDHNECNVRHSRNKKLGIWQTIELSYQSSHSYLLPLKKIFVIAREYKNDGILVHRRAEQSKQLFVNWVR